MRTGQRLLLGELLRETLKDERIVDTEDRCGIHVAIEVNEKLMKLDSEANESRY